ncbi:MAG: alpha/beta hydrolase [Chloroflexi bacterium]|nr:alpha/beta hydrolase [Chloroflexota bacterium]
MSDWLSGEVVTNGIRMHYHRTGGDKPALVLSHGATDNGLCWTRVARVLEADYDVVMPDARGHGQSSAPDSGYSSADHAADLAGLIRALGLQRPALGGHSMGAGTTLRLIADEPDLASCAVLEDPGLRLPNAAPLRGQADPRTSIRQVVLDAQCSDLETTIRRGREASPLWGDDEWQPWAQAKQQLSRQFVDTLGSGPMPQDWQELLGRVRCPVLLVTSDPERGGIVTPEAAQVAARVLPSLEVVRLPGAGHNIRREQFDGFVSAVRGFLAAHYPTTTPAS